MRVRLAACVAVAAALLLLAALAAGQEYGGGVSAEDSDGESGDDEDPTAGGATLFDSEATESGDSGSGESASVADQPAAASEASEESGEPDILSLMKRLAAGKGQKIAGGVVTFVMDNRNQMATNRKELEEHTKKKEEEAAKQRDAVYVEEVREEKAKMLSEHTAKSDAWKMEKEMYRTKHQSVLDSVRQQIDSNKKDLNSQLQWELLKLNQRIRQTFQDANNQREVNKLRAIENERLLKQTDVRLAKLVEAAKVDIKKDVEAEKRKGELRLQAAKTAAEVRAQESKKRVDASTVEGKANMEATLQKYKAPAQALQAQLSKLEDEKGVWQNRNKDLEEQIVTEKKRRMTGKVCNCESVKISNPRQLNTWYNCPNNKFLVGFERTRDDGLNGITHLRCCNACKEDGQSVMITSGCQTANWGLSFDSIGWSNCPDNTYIRGYYRSVCDRIYCIEYVSCCKADGSRGSAKCEANNQFGDANRNAGSVYISDNSLLMGLFRQRSQALSSITGARQCMIWAY